MKKTKSLPIRWRAEPEDHDYPAAASYLGLLFNAEEVAKMIKKLRKAKVAQFKAKDIFRASGLSLLGVSNSHVEKDQEKIRKEIPLSPLLLVRNPKNAALIIADGYHRTCAVYSFDEDALIPCKII